MQKLAVPITADNLRDKVLIYFLIGKMGRTNPNASSFCSKEEKELIDILIARF